MSDESRIRGVVLGAAALVLVAIGALAWRFRPPAPEPDLADVPARAPAPDAVVISADGGVERRAAGGAWAPVRAGDALAPTDSIRAGEGGSAEVALGKAAHLTLAERTEVTVRELTAAAQRVGLVRGRIAVDVEPDGTRVLRIEDASGTIVARGASGRFGVIASPAGIAVASARGSVLVESGGKTVELAPGQETAARRGLAPQPPRAVPREIVMRVARQIDERRASTCLVLHADPAAEVSVDGEPVEVPPDGNVTIRLPARARRRAVEVVVRDAGGGVERRTLPCWEAEGDVSNLDVRWHAR